MIGLLSDFQKFLDLYYDAARIIFKIESKRSPLQQKHFHLLIKTSFATMATFHSIKKMQRNNNRINFLAPQDSSPGTEN